MELAVTAVLFLINIIFGVPGTMDSKVCYRLNLFLAGAAMVLMFQALAKVI